MARAKKRPDGYYRLSFTYDHKRYNVFAKTQTELAGRKIKKIEDIEKKRQKSLGAILDHDNPTLDSFYRTFTERRRGRIAESTLRSQGIQYGAVRGIPVMEGKTLGETRIRDITPSDIETVQKALQKRNLKTCSINNYIDHLKHVFNEAIKLDLIDKNPCRTVYSLQRTEKPARDTIHRALTTEEIETFIQGATERHSYYLPLFLFMLNTGVRVGEAGAITEDEIETGKVHIVRTIAKGEIGGYHFQKPKTTAGNRVIPLNTEAQQAIEAQRDYLVKLGLDKRPEKLILDTENPVTHPRKPTLFCSPEGKLLRDYAVDREIGRICKDKGIRRFTSHAFRDTFATLYTQAYPTKWKTLQKILGHKDADTTLNIYIHALESDVEDTMHKFRIRA